MTDSMDEWDGGAIDGRDQYIADAPYWNGDGETIDATDNSEGQVTAENVPDPGEELGADRADGTETDEPEVPTWPPNPETLTELRRRLLNGASTESLGGTWTSATNGALYTAAVGETFADVEADIPALKTVGNGQATTWVIDEDAETQSELSHDDFRRNEPDGSWPPVAARIDNIRQRLVNGESSAKIAEEYSVGKDAIQEIAKGNTYNEHPAQEATETPPVRYISQSEEWMWAEPVDLETETPDNDDPEPETETTDSEEDLEPETEQQESGLVSGDERPVARNPPEPETPTVPTRWLVAGVAFVAGWVLSRLLRGGDD